MCKWQFDSQGRLLVIGRQLRAHFHNKNVILEGHGAHHRQDQVGLEQSYGWSICTRQQWAPLAEQFHVFEFQKTCMYAWSKGRIGIRRPRIFSGKMEDWLKDKFPSLPKTSIFWAKDHCIKVLGFGPRHPVGSLYIVQKERFVPSPLSQIRPCIRRSLPCRLLSTQVLD